MVARFRPDFENDLRRARLLTRCRLRRRLLPTALERATGAAQSKGARSSKRLQLKHQQEQNKKHHRRLL